VSTYLEPWEAVTRDRAALIAAEIERELHPTHALSGRRLRVLAARCDCDDVLCAVDETRYAVVHVIWTGRQESSPHWPSTEFFASFDDWRERGMKVDHEDYVS
jgi:hypothetical protein